MPTITHAARVARLRELAAAAESMPVETARLVESLSHKTRYARSAAVLKRKPHKPFGSRGTVVAPMDNDEAEARITRIERQIDALHLLQLRLTMIAPTVAAPTRSLLVEEKDEPSGR